MSNESPEPLALAEPESTTVGNYFVANYPPFSFWKPEYVAELHGALEHPSDPETPLGVYVHIPFCRRRCHFCYFRVYTDKNSSQIRQYTNSVLTDLENYAARPCIGDRRPRFVYFGGGTPSYLSAEQLRELIEGMKHHLPWTDAEEVAFECEPGTLNEKKLRTLKELGITRLSLGIENFDQHILEVNGRAHGEKEIGRAYSAARRVGFDQINIDLIAGMVDETSENWAQCVSRTIELAPECVTIYQMEIPYNTTIYDQMKQAGRVTAPVADWASKRQWVDEAFAELESAGYTVTSAYTAVKDPQRSKFVYRDLVWTGADLVSIGVASFGVINGVHYQNEHNWEPYLAALDRGELPIHRAMSMNTQEKFIREFILQMKFGSVSQKYFLQKFGVDVATHFQLPLGALANKGYVVVDEEGVKLSRKGLLRVDTLLPEFFLPEHREARYA